MPRSRTRALAEHLLGAALLLAATAGRAAAQAPDDAPPYVPTPVAVVDEMLGLARVGPGDVLYDLGSGDGRIPIIAAQRFGTRGVGYEIEPNLVEISRAGAEAAGVDSLVHFVADDLFTADLSAASVVTLYLGARMNLDLRPRLLRQLRPGARVVSHDFHMGAWAPDSVVHLGEGIARTTLFLWTVPADVDGFWQLTLRTARGERAFVLEFDQRFQRLAGAARQDGATLRLVAGAVRGEHVAFTLRDETTRRPVTYRFTGRLVGGELQGSYSEGRGPALPWRAARFTR
jgi:hypothetical protein